MVRFGLADFSQWAFTPSPLLAQSTWPNYPHVFHLCLTVPSPSLRYWTPLPNSSRSSCPAAFLAAGGLLFVIVSSPVSWPILAQTSCVLVIWGCSRALVDCWICAWPSNLPPFHDSYIHQMPPEVNNSKIKSWRQLWCFVETDLKSGLNSSWLLFVPIYLKYKGVTRFDI